MAVSGQGGVPLVSNDLLLRLAHRLQGRKDSGSCVPCSDVLRVLRPNTPPQPLRSRTERFPIEVPKTPNCSVRGAPRQEETARVLPRRVPAAEWAAECARRATVGDVQPVCGATASLRKPSTSSPRAASRRDSFPPSALAEQNPPARRQLLSRAGVGVVRNFPLSSGLDGDVLVRSAPPAPMSRKFRLSASQETGGGDDVRRVAGAGFTCAQLARAGGGARRSLLQTVGVLSASELQNPETPSKSDMEEPPLLHPHEECGHIVHRRSRSSVRLAAVPAPPAQVRTNSHLACAGAESLACGLISKLGSLAEVFDWLDCNCTGAFSLVQWEAAENVLHVDMEWSTGHTAHELFTMMDVKNTGLVSRAVWERFFRDVLKDTTHVEILEGLAKCQTCCTRRRPDSEVSDSLITQGYPKVNPNTAVTCAATPQEAALQDVAPQNAAPNMPSQGDGAPPKSAWHASRADVDSGGADRDVIGSDGTVPGVRPTPGVGEEGSAPLTSTWAPRRSRVCFVDEHDALGATVGTETSSPAHVPSDHEGQGRRGVRSARLHHNTSNGQIEDSQGNSLAHVPSSSVAVRLSQHADLICEEPPRDRPQRDCDARRVSCESGHLGSVSQMARFSLVRDCDRPPTRCTSSSSSSATADTLEPGGGVAQVAPLATSRLMRGLSGLPSDPVDKHNGNTAFPSSLYAPSSSARFSAPAVTPFRALSNSSDSAGIDHDLSAPRRTVTAAQRRGTVGCMVSDHLTMSCAIVFKKFATGKGAKDTVFLRPDLQALIESAVTLQQGAGTGTRRYTTADLTSEFSKIFDETRDIQVELGCRVGHGLTLDYFQHFLGKVAHTCGWTLASFAPLLLVQPDD